MGAAAIRQTLIRLIQDAPIIAPSIANFDIDRTYGRVTDERLDTAGQIRFEIEAEAVLADMASSGETRYVALQNRYSAKKVEAEHFHSKSIQIRETQQFLKAALAMLDNGPNAGGEVTRNAIRATPASAKEGALDRAGITPLPTELAAVLMDLWRSSVAARGRVDRPTYQEAHRSWIQILAELEAERCIAQDGDAYRLTPLGLLQLEDEEAANVLRVGDELRVVLRERYLSLATRKQPVLIGELALRLGLQRDYFCFALIHLSDALIQWASNFNPDFAAAEASIFPDERVRKATSISEVARRLATWAEEYKVSEVRPQVEAAARQQDKNDDKTLVDKWLDALKNKPVIAGVVVVFVVIVGIGSFADSISKIKCTFFHICKEGESHAADGDQAAVLDSVQEANTRFDKILYSAEFKLPASDGRVAALLSQLHELATHDVAANSVQSGLIAVSNPGSTSATIIFAPKAWNEPSVRSLLPGLQGLEAIWNAMPLIPGAVWINRGAHPLAEVVKRDRQGTDLFLFNCKWKENSQSGLMYYDSNRSLYLTSIVFGAMASDSEQCWFPNGTIAGIHHLAKSHFVTEIDWSGISAELEHPDQLLSQISLDFINVSVGQSTIFLHDMKVVPRGKGVNGANPHMGFYAETQFPSESDILGSKFAQPPARMLSPK